MFNKLKQYKDLRDQAKTLQSALAQESVTVERSGIKLTLNGNLEVTALSIPGEIGARTLENSLKDIFNDAIKKTQKIMARKMQEMGGLPGFGS